MAYKTDIDFGIYLEEFLEVRNLRIIIEEMNREN